MEILGQQYALKYHPTAHLIKVSGECNILLLLAQKNNGIVCDSLLSIDLTLFLRI